MVYEKRVLAHRLVAAAFIDNPENKSCVTHINHNKADNRVHNLRWVTRSEAMRNRSKTEKSILDYD